MTEDEAQAKFYESIYNGALSLAGFLLAVFMYSFIEYRKYTGAAQGEFPAVVPAVSAILLVACGCAAVIGFLGTHQRHQSWIKWTYIGILSSLIAIPPLVWIAG